MVAASDGVGVQDFLKSELRLVNPKKREFMDTVVEQQMDYLLEMNQLAFNLPGEEIRNLEKSICEGNLGKTTFNFRSGGDLAQKILRHYGGREQSAYSGLNNLVQGYLKCVAAKAKNGKKE